MNGITQSTAALDALVERGEVTGYVAGVRDRSASAGANAGAGAGGSRADAGVRVVSGGTVSVDGASMTPEAVFPLSSNSKPIGGVLAMALVERGMLELDDPVDQHLPELASLRVLCRPDGPLDETVSADRPITLRHLLTMTAGFGWVDANPALGEAMAERDVGPGPYAPPLEPGEYLRRLAELPLATQPGEGWWYHTCSDVLGVLLARATGRTLSDLLEEFVTGPLGLADTGFTAAADRMPTSYGNAPDGSLRPLDTVDRFAGPPEFESLACGLVSTVGDYLTFLEMLVDGGPVLTETSARMVTADHLTDPQRRTAQGVIEPGAGYGFQVEVRPGGLVGWAGGLGTIGYVDRSTGRSAAVFTTQSLELPGAMEALNQVWGLLAE